MKDLKQTSFAERQAAAAEARKAMLAKFKPKPTVTAPEGVVSRAEQREKELQEVRETRQRVRDIWGQDEAAVVAWVNETLADADAVPRLVDHDDLGWHIHATTDESPLAERMLVEAAMALVDVVRADRLDRLRDCEADDCTGVFIDLSKNGSKRFCSARCGNRIAVRAYRARALGD